MKHIFKILALSISLITAASILNGCSLKSLDKDSLAKEEASHISTENSKKDDTSEEQPTSDEKDIKKTVDNYFEYLRKAEVYKIDTNAISDDEDNQTGNTVSLNKDLFNCISKGTVYDKTEKFINGFKVETLLDKKDLEPDNEQKKTVNNAYKKMLKKSECEIIDVEINEDKNKATVKYTFKMPSISGDLVTKDLEKARDDDDWKDATDIERCIKTLEVLAEKAEKGTDIEFKKIEGYFTLKKEKDADAKEKWLIVGDSKEEPKSDSENTGNDSSDTTLSNTEISVSPTPSPSVSPTPADNN